MDWVPMVTGVLVAVLGLGMGAPRWSHAQDVPPDVREQAARDYHGPDGEGKDGPLAKVGYDLILLYHEYEAYRAKERAAPFQPHGVDATVADGYVVIDALARGQATELREDLERLGMKGAASAGSVVSGRIPIEVIPKVARLSTLRSAHPARPLTQRGSSPDSPATGLSEDAGSALWYMGVAVAFVIIAGASAVLLNRRRRH